MTCLDGLGRSQLIQIIEDQDSELVELRGIGKKLQDTIDVANAEKEARRIAEARVAELEGKR